MKQDIQAMQLFVDSMVGIPKFSYPAKKDAPRPANEFCHIQLLEEYAVGLPVKTWFSEDATSTTYRVRAMSRLRFRLGIVETEGIASTKIMHGWTSEAMKGLMISTGYGFCKCEPISIEDAKLEQFWEARQGFSVELYVERVYTETIDFIETLIVTGEYEFAGLDSILMVIEVNYN